MTSKQARRLIVAGLALAGLIASTPLHYERPASPLAIVADIQEPTFSFKWRRGQLRMVGHTLSAAHEQSLLRHARLSFANKISYEFLPFGGVPTHWSGTTLHALGLLSAMESGFVRVSATAVSIRGVVADEADWHSAVASVQTSLPPDVLWHEDVIVIDPALEASELCERAFSEFEIGPISFKESTAIMRSSAYPQLQRLAAIADACRNATVAVAGHTDASGNEAWNNTLSLRRAQAVADYLASVGIKRERIEVSGMGSSMPLADNATRYGRSLNRRIEVDLKQPRS